MMHIIAYPPYFRKIYKFPNFCEIDVFCLIDVVFASPYFDHDVFHALRVLDAPALVVVKNTFVINQVMAILRNTAL